ncbi:uncharacterized protein F54H12.2-like [Crassostrea angulata]|uniref:uncharacterized protein F54H12.2-like n=1 Tax=Magallana angulata TaxID=2784310 RepID=UPI0022B157C8|nr:uncharacterized protein F54H12.2-like [Crassostrea angulata]
MMHRESCMCGMESLELFQVPPTNIALQESKWMEYYPVASTLNSDTAPIEFDIQGQGDEFIDLSQTYLQVVCKFTKGDGSNLTDGHMDDAKLDAATQSKSQFDVPAGDNPKVTVTAANLELSYPDGAKNEGLRKRHDIIEDSKKITLIDRLYLDLFQQDRFIPNGVDIRLRFNRAKSDFYMMTAAGSTGKVSIISILLWVRKVKPTPTVLNAINQRLNTETAKYPLRRVEVKTFTIPNGIQSKISDHLFQGQMPKRLVIGFVPNASFNGDSTKNPFNFKNYKVKKLEVSINGDTISTRPFEPDFTNNLYLRSYLSLYQGLGKFGSDWAPDINFEEYKDGYTLWCIDFTKDQEAQLDKFHLIETGNLRIEVQFGENTPEALNCLVYAEFDNLLEINKQREVNIDY